MIGAKAVEAAAMTIGQAEEEGVIEVARAIGREAAFGRGATPGREEVRLCLFLFAALSTLFSQCPLCM